DSTNIVTAVPMEEEPPKDVVYYVKKGDTMSAIADRYHITARKIADYNKIGNINALSIGQKLIIPR
ncbi:MAG: LysM peptidoglycan-binding domain-containing protein, partial [Bacteroidales bacterium]